jgi:hypothetical protein
MEVGQGPNWGCSAKEKKGSFKPRIRENRNRSMGLHNNNFILPIPLLAFEDGAHVDGV